MVAGDANTSRQEFLENLFHRIGLIVLLDFHAVDASRLCFAFQAVGRERMRQSIGLFVQMQGRIGDEQQITLLRATLPKGDGDRLAHAQLTEDPAEHGVVWLHASKALRTELSTHWGYEGINANFPTEAYFGLRPRRGPDAGRPFEMFFVQNPGEPPVLAYEGDRDKATRFEFKIREMPTYNLPDQPIIRDFDPSTGYFPNGNRPIGVVSDPGNIAAIATTDFAFGPRIGDHLLFLVSAGYLGRSYVAERLTGSGNGHDRDALARLLAPMAQQPGVGISDVVNRLTRLLSRASGVEQDEAARVRSTWPRVACATSWASRPPAADSRPFSRWFGRAGLSTSPPNGAPNRRRDFASTRTPTL